LALQKYSTGIKLKKPDDSASLSFASDSENDKSPKVIKE
jgi:hypothetical protein